MDESEIRRERALVRAGWELVDLLGQVGEKQARNLLAARWEAERARAAAQLSPLKTGKKIGQRMRGIYEGPSNQARYLRISELVQPDERVFEIGPGRGYLAGLLLRDRGVAAYRGVDINDYNLEATQELLELNGVADRAALSHCDIYELPRSDVESFGADVVVCCEVIEHVPDPEQAVKALATALPAGADLLMSVPLLGRLESVWGHLSIFDTARIRDMVEGSGLVVHAVDVVDNVWVFVLASHDQGPSERAARAALTAVNLPPDGRTPATFQALSLESPEIRPTGRNADLARSHIEPGKDGLSCELTAKRLRLSKETQYGGVRFPLSALLASRTEGEISPRGLRLQLALDDIEQVTTFHVDAYAGDRRLARWTWDPATARPTQSLATFVLRSGMQNRFFRPNNPANLGKLTSADAIELIAGVRPGGSVRFRIAQAAVIV